MANTRAIAEIWSTNATASVTATRGRNLALERLSFSGREEGAEEFLTELLSIVELNADERIASLVVFDLDDFDAAIAELDARYLAGEAAAHAHTWSAVCGPTPQSTGKNSSRRLPTGSISITVGAQFAPGDANAYVRASLDDGEGNIYVETVHRLGDLGAVVTWAAMGPRRRASTPSGAGSTC